MYTNTGMFVKTVGMKEQQCATVCAIWHVGGEKSSGIIKTDAVLL